MALLREPPSQTVCDFDESTSTGVIIALAEVLRVVDEVPDYCPVIASAQLRRWLSGVPSDYVEHIVKVFGIEGISFFQTVHCISDVYLKGRSKHFWVIPILSFLWHSHHMASTSRREMRAHS